MVVFNGGCYGDKEKIENMDGIEFNVVDYEKYMQIEIGSKFDLVAVSENGVTKIKIYKD